MTKFERLIPLTLDLLAMAICLAVAFGLEFVLRALVSDWWPWFWLALIMAAHLLVVVLPDRHFARLVSRYPVLLRWSPPSTPIRPDIAKVEAERQALVRLLTAPPTSLNGKSQ